MAASDIITQLNTLKTKLFPGSVIALCGSYMEIVPYPKPPLEIKGLVDETFCRYNYYPSAAGDHVRDLYAALPENHILYRDPSFSGGTYTPLLDLEESVTNFSAMTLYLVKNPELYEVIKMMQSFKVHSPNYGSLALFSNC
jgi:hypothetical protein